MSPVTPTLRPTPTATFPAETHAGADLLAALAARNLAGHAERVFTLTARVCRRLGITDRPAGVIALAALFHDVGKLALPDELLTSEGPLGKADRELLRRHSVLGEEMLVEQGMPALAPLVRHTHERWDGLGYPDGLACDRIPRGSRIIAACDTWDAMRSDRPYQPARSHDEALGDLVAASGSQLEPAVVAALVTEVTRQGLT
jgi:HD-GYP domain-containing protein (c-di-GMP phosphodiesterase class II)